MFKGGSYDPLAGVGVAAASASSVTIDTAESIIRLPDAAQSLVLVVDDDPDVRLLIVQILRREGHRVLEAPDAPTALALCDSNDFDLALLDVEMPGMNGYDLLRAIDGRVIDRHLPVILITARVHAADVATGLGLGASDYLRKPFEAQELLARVEAALRIKRLQDQLRQKNVELHRLSTTDSLTGAYNRRHLDDRIGVICESANRHGDRVAVLMIDIDHFKRINDDYGHPAGDDVLRAVAGRLQVGLRAEDVLGRWGGEEFLLLLPRTGALGAVISAERLRSAVADELFTADGNQIAVTVSIGVASSQNAEPDVLIARADRALYDAKAAGRNRVEGG